MATFARLGYRAVGQGLGNSTDKMGISLMPVLSDYRAGSPIKYAATNVSHMISVCQHLPSHHPGYPALPGSLAALEQSSYLQQPSTNYAL